MSRPTTQAEEYAQDYARKRLYDDALAAIIEVINAEQEAEFAPAYRAPLITAAEKLRDRSDQVVAAWN